MITGQTTYPGDVVAGAGLRPDRSGRPVHGGGGMRDLRRRRVARQVALSYFTGEPTLNIVHQQFVKPDGVSYTTEKEAGPRADRVHPQRDLWFRPIETRVGPDGALYVVDFYNQAVIHNDTRGPLHGPANAAVRPDRDHYFGRIWRVQHKQARSSRAGAEPARPRRADPRDGDEPERARQGNGVAARAGELRGRSAARADQAADGKQGARALREGARARPRPPQRKLLDTFARATTTGRSRPSPPGHRAAPAAYVAEAFAVRSAAGLADFVRRSCRRRCRPTRPSVARSGRRGRGRRRSPLKAALGARRRADGGRAGDGRRRRRRRCGTLLDDPATTAAALPIVAKWDKAGALSASADGRASSSMLSSPTPSASDERRADSAASLLACRRAAPQRCRDRRRC